MAPSVVENGAQSNTHADSHAGLLPPSHWTPETVLSTLPNRPATHTTSPLPFLHLIERLKTNKREGWRRFGIEHGESISDHMYRMSIITMLCPTALAARLDIARCTQMALIHDMAESLVGDITPVDGVPKSEKSRRETETMDFLCGGLLGRYSSGVQGKQMREVWQEYEDGKTLESQFVHDVDKMELLLQMLEYERALHGKVELGEFAWVARRIVLPEVQTWADELLQDRERFWAAQGKASSGVVEVAEERKRQQDEYYGRGTAVSNGTSPDDCVEETGSSGPRLHG